MDTTMHDAETAVSAHAADLQAAASVEGRLLDRTEMIERLANDLRLKSGLDLPHAYFVQQIKLQLSGSPAFDHSLLEPESPAARRAANYQSAACFEAWAIRD